MESDAVESKPITQEQLMANIAAGVPTILPYARRTIMPLRAAFTDKSLRGQFASMIRTGKPIIFMPNTVCDKIEWTSGKGVYKSYVFGTLPDGSKACVILDGIEVSYQLRVPKDTTDAEFTAVLRRQMESSRVNYTGIKTVELLPMRDFHTAPVPYKHITFNNTLDRRAFIDMVANMNSLRAGKEPIETASDDTGYGNFYFTKAAREYRFNTADWNRLDNYKLEPVNVTTNCAYTIRTHVRDYKRLDAERRAALSKPGHPLSSIMDRDPTMIVSWDIETWSPVQNGTIPTAADQGFVIKMICAAYFPQHSNNAYLRVCCTMHPVAPRAGIDVVIHCANELEVLDAHTEIWGRMAPDVAVATNGSNFDWPLVREKMRRYGMLTTLKSRFSSLPLQVSGRNSDTEISVHKYSFRSEKIKIDATTSAPLDTVADFPGLLDTDLTPIFTKMYPRNEVRKAASLNFFLQSNGLESKEDMPYKRMFKIFERAVALRHAPTVCHCGTPCKLCDVCVKEIDCKPLDNELYSTERLDDPTRCCNCTKRPRNLTDMADVAYYCIIDCVRPQQLYVKRMIVADKRELATLSYTQLYDAFYRADGMKVTNLIGANCHEYNIAFSSVNRVVSDSDKDFYPGAWVFPPNRGLHSDGWINITDQQGNCRRVRMRPTTGLDFASLYPSLMMTYNLSPDMVVRTPQRAQELAALGYSIHHIKPFQFERGEKKGAPGNRKLIAEGWIVRHNGVVHASETHTIDGYDKSVPADGGKPVYTPRRGREKLPGERMGIFPFVVKQIFDKRVPIKKQFLHWDDIREEMESEKLKTITVDGVEYTYDEVIFYKNKVDATQKALKIFANTFYGKSGEYRASIYELLVAAGITCAGQANIKMVARFVESLGYIVHYGDTDSVYISCPDDLFAECDRVYEETMEAIHARWEGTAVLACPTPGTPEAEYKAERIAARLVWWTEQVRITQEDITKLTVKVSEMLMADNGTRALNMAYEEVGMPSAYCGKKKYYMTAHTNKINFEPKKPFIRGIDIVKQGQAPITKILGEDFIRESLSVTNERSLMEICLDKIARFSEMTSDPRLFVQSARYKPQVKNVTVKLFVERMRDRHRRYTDAGDHVMAALYEPPEPGDKFDYVVVMKEQRFTLSGAKIALKKGDRMEFLRVYEYSQTCAEPMKLDLAHYMEKAIVGLFSRFICYHDDFQPSVKYDLQDKDQYTAFDNACLKAASKYLLTRNQYGVDTAAMTAMGRDYRSIYGHASKCLRTDLSARLGGAAYVINNIAIGAEQRVSIIDQINTLVSEITANVPVDNGLVATSKDVFALRAVYCTAGGISRNRINMLTAREKALVESVHKHASALSAVITRYNADVVRVIEDLRRDRTDEIVILDEDLEEIHGFGDADRAVISQIFDTILQLAAVRSLRAETAAHAMAIEKARAETVCRRLEKPCGDKSAMASRAPASDGFVEYTWM